MYKVLKTLLIVSTFQPEDACKAAPPSDALFYNCDMTTFSLQAAAEAATRPIVVHK